MNIMVFFLLIVIAVMALWIKELIYRKNSDQNIIDYLRGENSRKESALFEIQKTLLIEAGGIYRRISENKEILELLNLEHLENYSSKILTETNIFWLLDAHHQFLLSLAYLAKEHGLEGASDFEVYAGGHRIDDIEIFKAVGRQLEKQPFVIERLSQLKKEYGD